MKFPAVSAQFHLRGTGSWVSGAIFRYFASIFLWNGLTSFSPHPSYFLVLFSFFPPRGGAVALCLLQGYYRPFQNSLVVSIMKLSLSEFQMSKHCRTEFKNLAKIRREGGDILPHQFSIKISWTKLGWLIRSTNPSAKFWKDSYPLILDPTLSCK